MYPRDIVIFEQLFIHREHQRAVFGVVRVEEYEAARRERIIIVAGAVDKPLFLWQRVCKAVRFFRQILREPNAEILHPRVDLYAVFLRYAAKTLQRVVFAVCRIVKHARYRRISDSIAVIPRFYIQRVYVHRLCFFEQGAHFFVALFGGTVPRGAVFRGFGRYEPVTQLAERRFFGGNEFEHGIIFFCRHTLHRFVPEVAGAPEKLVADGVIDIEEFRARGSERVVRLGQHQFLRYVFRERSLYDGHGVVCAVEERVRAVAVRLFERGLVFAVAGYYESAFGDGGVAAVNFAHAHQVFIHLHLVAVRVGAGSAFSAVYDQKILLPHVVVPVHGEHGFFVFAVLQMYLGAGFALIRLGRVGTERKHKTVFGDIRVAFFVYAGDLSVFYDEFDPSRGSARGFAERRRVQYDRTLVAFAVPAGDTVSLSVYDGVIGVQCFDFSGLDYRLFAHLNVFSVRGVFPAERYDIRIRHYDEPFAGPACVDDGAVPDRELDKIHVLFGRDFAVFVIVYAHAVARGYGIDFDFVFFAAELEPDALYFGFRNGSGAFHIAHLCVSYIFAIRNVARAAFAGINERAQQNCGGEQ